NGKELLRFAERFQLVDTLNFESIIDFFCGLGPHARNLDHLRKTRRNLLLQILVELNLAAADVLINFAGEIFANTRHISQRTTRSKCLDIIREPFDIEGSAAVCTNAKRIRPLNFQKIRYLIEDERNLEIPHEEMITKATGRGLQPRRRGL